MKSYVDRKHTQPSSVRPPGAVKLDSLEETATRGLKNTQELPILYNTKENSSRQRKERVPRHMASHKGS